MMNRMRRTVQRKSPSPTTSEDSLPPSSSRKFSSNLFGEGSSPILTHRTATASSAAGLGATYAFRPAQKSLLQSVMRNLMDSEDDQERTAQRAKLENDLSITSERLDSLVQEHRVKLHSTLSTFDAMDKKIRDSQEKIGQVKASLKSCKSLLRCKRDELKRLWLEDVKYKHMLQMIENIEEVRSVPERVAKLKASKHYLEATELLQNSVASLDKKLSNVEALKDLKVELKQQKENLHEELIDELHRHLYVKAAAVHRPGQHVRAFSDGQGAPTPTKRVATLTRTTQALPKAQLEATVSGTGEKEDSLQVVRGSVDPERDSSQYMAVLVESLSMLGRVQEALDAIQQRMEKEFLLIIEKASIQVTRTRDQEEGHVGRKGRGFVQENMPKQLTKMLQICFERFRGVVSAHTVLLGHFKRTKETYKAPYSLYDISDVWIAIQQVVQSALQVYLAYDESGLLNEGLSGYAAFSSPGDAPSMFARRKPPSARVTKKPLFRFDSSRHAISISSYMREQRDLELASGEEGAQKAVAARHYEQEQPSISQHLVCKPHNRNITVIFKVVKDFTEEVDKALGLGNNQHCQLHDFLLQYVEQDFLERIRCEYNEKMATCSKPEAAKTLAPDQKTTKVTGAKLSVLNSILTVWQLVVELRQLMKDLPLYSGHFLSILCDLLVGYKESLELLYKGLTTVAVETVVGGGRHGGGGAVGGATTQEGVISCNWAKDEEVIKLLKSMSTWIKVRQRQKPKEEDRVQTVYSKESEFLISSLKDPLQKHNVILNHDNLRLLAMLHESLDWFSGRLQQVVFELGETSEATDGASLSTPVPQNSFNVTEDLELVQHLSSVQMDFQTLAEMTIIMLHLEVRCHCFHFLLPALQKSNYVFGADGVEEDTGVKQLATDLKNIDLVMVAVLSQEKYRYLFEGVGHVVAAIFISSTNYIKNINTNGVKKMCRNIFVLQSCLSKITLIRERELDKARKYFEMLYLTFDEITENILEHGPMYSEEDYKRALQLLANTGKGDNSAERDEKLELQLQQLSNIFSGDTV